MKYMFYYDTVHGRYPGTVTVDNGKLVIDGTSSRQRSVHPCKD